MRKLILAFAAVALAGAAYAQPYYVRGAFNGWSGTGNEMVDQGGGRWAYTVTGLATTGFHEMKATVDDWSFNAPADNLRVVASPAGEVALNFYPNTSWSDGWEPASRPRLGYEDPAVHGWEVMGSFNGWSAPLVTLSNLGGGLYRGDVAITTGAYEFKFRKIGDWDVTLGNGDFSGAGGNNSLNIASDGTYRFEIDLPHGRWRVVPEPTALALAALALALVRRR